MSQPRLERLIARQLGECCKGDVEARLELLSACAERAAQTADTDVATLGTLGDETRYRLARILVAADRELCVCELEPVVDVSESAVSHALSDLRDAGLVTRRKDGTWRYYAATDRAEALLAALDARREDQHG
ncbi:MAG: metalloregulator ArsR/SmtB family transcription factor [Haloarculaceae archaeon]